MAPFTSITHKRNGINVQCDYYASADWRKDCRETDVLWSLLVCVVTGNVLEKYAAQRA